MSDNSNAISISHKIELVPNNKAITHYIGGDQVVIKDTKYLKVPNYGLVKMREKLRFNGKINSCTISQSGDKFYASFSVEISQDEYNKTHKATVIVRNFDYIGLENLNTQGMMKNHKLAKSLVDVSFYEFNRQLEYKADYQDKEIYRVDKCESCGNIIDRDINASINLHKFVNKSVKLVQSEFTPMDLTAMQYDLAINQIATSKVEIGIQQKLYL
ncbi:hypothetical protein CDQ71_07555 [Campylobacter hyointestinalis subsp. hyointestinalis]|nr:hypothetical protein CDQ71_07555 [Campylobacter hyointestinalis subsp. hyointestinalis]